MQSKKHDFPTKEEMEHTIGAFFCGLASMLVVPTEDRSFEGVGAF